MRRGRQGLVKVCMRAAAAAQNLCTNNRFTTNNCRSPRRHCSSGGGLVPRRASPGNRNGPSGSSARSKTDRKSTRLNSSHLVISYAVFCLKKKKKSNESDSPTALRAPYKTCLDTTHDND